MKLLVSFLLCFLSGCDVQDTALSSLHLPVVVELKLDAPNQSVLVVDKSYVQPLLNELKKIPHITNIHPKAYANCASITLFFEMGPTYSDIVQEITKVLPNIKDLQEKNNLKIIQLLESDLTLSNFVHLGNMPHLSQYKDQLMKKFDNAFQPIITITSELPKSLLSQDDHDALFTDECDEVPDIEVPLYALDHTAEPVKVSTLEDLAARKAQYLANKQSNCKKKKQSGKCIKKPISCTGHLDSIKHAQEDIKK